MSSLNKAMIIGRLGSDPEMRYTQSKTAVATLSVATTERYKDKNGQQQESTQWHRITAWGRLAEICQEYLTKGSLAYFEGPIETKEWKDKEGNKRYTTEIKALSMQMLDSKGSNGKISEDSGNSGSGIANNFDDMSDELPFAWLLLPFGFTLMQIIGL